MNVAHPLRKPSIGMIAPDKSRGFYLRGPILEQRRTRNELGPCWDSAPSKLVRGRASWEPRIARPIRALGHAPIRRTKHAPAAKSHT